MTPPDHVGDDPVPHAGGGSQGLSTARLTGLLNGTYVPRITPGSSVSSGRTLVASDLDTMLTTTHASNLVRLDLPDDATLTAPIGAQVEIARRGAGDVLVAPASAVTLRSPGSRRTISQQYSHAMLVKTAANEWDLLGDTAPLTVTDTMTDANSTDLTTHTSDRGHTVGNTGSWTQTTATGCIISLNRMQASGSGATMEHKTLPRTDTFDIDCSIYFNALTAGHLGGPMAIVSGANTGYYVAYVPASTRWELVKIVAGTTTFLASFTVTAYSATETHTVKLRITPTARLVYIDGSSTPNISSADTTVTPNSWGIRASFSSQQIDTWTGTAGT